jgi:hypothetical protein
MDDGGVTDESPIGEPVTDIAPQPHRSAGCACCSRRVVVLVLDIVTGRFGGWCQPVSIVVDNIT